MTASETHVVLGAGLAAAKAVEGMREAGFEGRIVVVGNEHHRPYERPPLSKDYLMGKAPIEDAFVHGSEWYGEHDVELRLGTTATGIDTAERAVITADGERLGYDRLLLATGASPTLLPVLDAGGVDATYLRTIEDSDRIKASLTADARVVIIGGGWIGLEVAAAARTAGADVTVLEAAELPLLRVLGPEIAEVFASLHQEHGVDLRTNSTVTMVEAAGDQCVVRLGDGESVTADLLVVGVGVHPNSGLAEAAGLEVGDGILVDAQLRTSDPHVWAAGDVANIDHPKLGRRIRVEHWDNAIGQGERAGRNMAGEEAAYDRMPYFFTDQYDLGMEYVGSVGPDGDYDVITRGDVDGRVFQAYWISDGHVAAGMHVNDWDAIDDIRAVVEDGDVARIPDR